VIGVPVHAPIENQSPITNHFSKHMPSVLIPTPLRKLTNELETVSAAGANVGELIDNLEKAFPGLKDRICDEAGNVRRFVNIFVNGEDIRFLSEKDTPVKDNDEISIVPAIAGG
jgi:molybdopterin synthase sulfur carrier subunit